MRYNVAQLLSSATGAQRRRFFEIPESEVEPLGDQIEFRSRLKGEVLLMRTVEGILVQGSVQTTVMMACSRCLRPVEIPVDVSWAEEYHPQVDIETGRFLDVDADDTEEGTVIDEHHILDLAEAVRQYLVLALPSRPVCQSDCQGLCPSCGADLNIESCQCQTEDLDPRWADLAGLLEKADKTEAA